MMVMTLSLLVYSFGQYPIRNLLKQQASTFPNQLGKGIQNPSMRWLCRLLQGIQLVHFELGGEQISRLTPLSDLLKRIIGYFGPEAMRIYDVPPL